MNFIERLHAETNNLQKKVNALKDFIATPKFDDLEEFHQGLLLAQQRHMVGYLNTLHIRLKYLDLPLIKMVCSHVDTCLPDYWRGHHLPYVQIPVWPGMTLEDIKGQLKSEIHQDSVSNGEEGEYDKYLQAVGDIESNSAEDYHFNEIDEDGDSVYAYFVFIEGGA